MLFGVVCGCFMNAGVVELRFDEAGVVDSDTIVFSFAVVGSGCESSGSRLFQRRMFMASLELEMNGENEMR